MARTARYLLTCVLVATLLAHSAQAGAAEITVTNVASFDFGQFSAGGGTGFFPTNFPHIPDVILPDFDPALGDLLRVDLGVTVNGSLGVKVLNNVIDPPTYTWTYDVSTLFRATLLNTFTVQRFENFEETSGTHTFSYGESLILAPLAFSSSETHSFTSGNDFLSFIGLGTRSVRLNLIHDFTTTPDSPGGMDVFITANGTTTGVVGAVSLAYTYDDHSTATEVPEPGTLTMWSMGLAVLAGRRKALRP